MATLSWPNALYGRKADRTRAIQCERICNSGVYIKLL